MQQRAIKKALVTCLAAIGVAAFALKFVLWSYLRRHSPAMPMPDTGQIYPLTDHSYYFYVSHFHSILQDALTYAFAVFAVTAGLLNWHWKAFSSPIDDMPKKFY
jgi:hypothetical protein